MAILPVFAPDKLYFRLPEVAQMLSLGRSTVYEMCERGELPATHFGRSIRISARALREWADRVDGTQVGD